MAEKLNVSKLIIDFKYEIISGNEFINKSIESTHIAVPGLELTGYLDYYDKKSSIILGEAEIKYLNTLDYRKLIEVLSSLFTELTPFICICQYREFSEEIINIANINRIPVIYSSSPRLTTLNALYFYLVEHLSKKELVHGTLVNVFGNGILLKGPSGIGKSEIALELINRGHQLVADDSVITFKRMNNLYGKAVDHQKHLIELRGLGLINIYRLFGLSSILEETKIDYVINLVNIDDIKESNRIFDTIKQEEINGVLVKTLELPVSGGRSVADIIEVSIRELSSRKLGYNTTEEFIKNYDKLVKEEL